MNQRAIEKTELNKILAIAAEYATLEGGKARLLKIQPTPNAKEAKMRLKITEEARDLLFTHGVCKVEYFPPFSDEIGRAKKGSALSCGELLKLENLLRSARIAFTSINGVADDTLVCMKEVAFRLYFDAALVEDILT